MGLYHTVGTAYGFEIPDTNDLDALTADAPWAYLYGTDRRMFADVYQAARLYTLALTIGGLPAHHLRPLAHAADWVQRHPSTPNAGGRPL
ncbi:hypothetical protein [Streptomyces olivaceus]|uniref:hypothetical protein n=1 Tax=Streptomyces olivaceus TaxID=47716 RepID=UPI0022EED30C|nr:hypothetical protein [Streptomyces olivaceus]GHI98118.1 hypothetical protein TPA0905_75890 [Streptomyces olivaceus]